MVTYKITRDRALLDAMPWQARDPNGRINVASTADIQDVFFKAGMVKQRFPTGRLVDGSFADYVAKQLGPFVLAQKDSKASGCR